MIKHRCIQSIFLYLLLLKTIYLQASESNANEPASLIFKTNATKCTMFSTTCRTSLYLLKTVSISEIVFASNNTNIFDVKNASLCPSTLYFEAEDVAKFQNGEMTCLNLKSEIKEQYNIYELELSTGIIGKSFLSASYKDEQIVHQISILTTTRLVDKYASCN